MKQDTMQVEAFGFDRQVDAIALLREGFPEVAPAVWARGFERMRQHPPPGAADTAGPVGAFLVCNGSPEGVGLTINRQFVLAGESRLVTNLSSWYVRPDSRRHSIAMYRTMTADSGRTYTDFSPTTVVARLLPHLGFRAVSHQLLLVSTPVVARLPGAGGVVVDADAAIAETVDTGLREALQTHRRLGCLVLGIRTANGMEPVVFGLRRRLRLARSAHLVYGRSLQIISDNIGPLARALLRRRCLFAEIPASQDTAVDFACLALFKRRFIKGQWPVGGVDQLYTESIYFPFYQRVH